MKRYLSIYRRLLSINLGVALMYRTDFFNSVFSSMLWGVFSLGAILLISSKAPMVAGWDRAGMLILGSAYGIIVGIFHVFFTRNFSRMSLILNKGELDGYLLKPVDSLWLLTSMGINLGGVVRWFASIILTTWLIAHFSLQVGWLQILQFAVASLMGALLLYSLFCLAGTALIWYTNLSNLIDLMTTMTGTGRYPREILSHAAMPVLVFIPFLLIVNVPVKILLGKSDVAEVMIFSGLALGFFLCSRWLWKIALRFYTSASG